MAIDQQPTITSAESDSEPRSTGAPTDASRDADAVRDELTKDALASLMRSMESSANGPEPLAAEAREESTELEVELIAQRIRRWRERSELTLNELARRSKVAASTIQKVETGQMVPTVAVLLKIARGLDRMISDLVREVGDDYQVAHLRKEERHRLRLDGMELERLVGDLFEPTLEVWRITFQPGRGSGKERVQFDGESLVLCEAGELTMAIGDEEYVLRPGDALNYKATLPHSWRNDGSEPATYVIVGTLPRAMRAALHDRLRNGA